MDIVVIYATVVVQLNLSKKKKINFPLILHLLIYSNNIQTL